MGDGEHHWTVIGQGDEVGEWPSWLWHCIIFDTGHGLKGERGLPDTTKKCLASSFLQSSSLSVKHSALFMFAVKRSEVHAKPSCKAPSLFWTTGVSALSFSNWAKQLVLEWIIHKRRGLRRRLFHDKEYFQPPVFRKSKVLQRSKRVTKILSSERQETGCSSQYFLVHLVFHYESILKHFHY